MGDFCSFVPPRSMPRVLGHSQSVSQSLIHACSPLMGHFFVTCPVLPLVCRRISRVTCRERNGAKVRDPLIMFPLDCNSRSPNEIYGNVPPRLPSCWLAGGVKRIDDIRAGYEARKWARGFSARATLQVNERVDAVWRRVKRKEY